MRSKRRITLDGGAYVIHESGGDNKPFSLRCQTIIADLEPVPTTQPAAKSATTEPTEEKMRLKHVVAQRQVEFTSLPMHFVADSIDYDPNTHILVARGNDRERAELYDEKGSLQGSFTQIRYNLQTGRIENMVGFRSTVRR